MNLHPRVGKKLLIIMRYSLMLLIIFLTGIQMLNAKKVTGQDLLEKRITVSLQDDSIEKALEKIALQAGIKFVYSNNLFTPSVPTISKSWQQEKTSVILSQVLSSLNVSYNEMKGNYIVLKKNSRKRAAAQAPGTTFMNVLLTDTTVTVRGRLINAGGQPISGASVVVAGSTKGTSTDMNGNYELRNVTPGAVLRFSNIGYADQEVALGGRSTVNISLQEKAEGSQLNEVVVIGYGTTTKRINTGSVSSITSKDIGSQPVLDPLAALQGRLPGLFATATNGLPGSNFNVKIRGVNSIGAGTDPLYVIDGIPYFSEPLNQFTSAYGLQSPLASINPADIERIDVLKDADATSIYGSRGANGVVLITTKKGKAGKTKFDFNVFGGGSKVSNKLKMLNTPDYIQMPKDAFENDGITPDDEKAPDLLLWDQNKTTDWQDYIIGHTARETQVQGSASGGNEQTSFLISGNYRKTTTVMGNDLGFKRGSVHLNLDHTTLDGKFNISTSLNYSSAKDNSLATDLTSFYNLAPNYPLYNPDGSYYWFGNMQNPEAYKLRTSVNTTNTLIANSVLRYTILSGLNVKLNLGYTNSDLSQMQLYPNLTFNPASTPGAFSYFGFTNVQTYIAEPQIDYSTLLGKGKLQLLAGATWQQSRRQGHGVTARNFSSESLLEDMYSAGELEARPANSTFYRYTAAFGRINYNLEDKYLLNATFRRDGSTRFGPGKRFGNFGAVGAAWIFSNESFFPDNSVLSFGKLRGSYGNSGNDQISDYQYLDSWSGTSFPYDGVAGLTPTRISNLEYRWEESRKTEVALELGFLNNRIMLNTSFYRNISDNLLVPYQLTPQVGFPSIQANLPATVLNSGVEVELNTINIKSRDFTWTSALNITFNHNELKKYPDFESSTYKYTYTVGKSLTVVKGFEFTGINPADGLAQFRDVDTSGSIEEEGDYIDMGKTMPDYYGGFQNTFTYKGFALDFLLQFVKQEGPGVNYGYLSESYGSLSNKDESALDRWRKPGDVTSVPRAETSRGEEYTNYRLSTAQWGDASYIRLKNISLRYDLTKYVKKWNLGGLSVYVLGQNLFTSTKYKGLDPETQGLYMPPLKTITAGIQLSF